MTAGPPTEPPILTAEQVHALDRRGSWTWPEIAQILGSHEALRADRDALRARLRDAEETLQRIADRRNLYASFLARAYFKRHADPQEKGNT